MGVDRLALRNRHCAKGSSMECALHRDDILLVCDAAHHLERRLDRLRARVYEEERIKRGVGHDGKQTFYEAQVRLMVRNGALTTAQYTPARPGRDEAGGKLTCPCTRLRHWSAAALLTLGWQ